jgi:hypothetical protein
MNEQSQINNSESVQTDKEKNFRALEARYEKQISQERAARQEAERIAQDLMKKSSEKDDDDDSEPYVDNKKLEKKLNKFGEQSRKQTQEEIRYAVNEALKEERKNSWLKRNPDFEEIMTNENGDKFHKYDPELAESMFQIPDEFERMKAVFKNIKALGLHKPPQKEQSIQEKIDSNRRSPYYQPSSVGSAPYAQTGDFSQQGQKNAYEKMQALKNKLRLD